MKFFFTILFVFSHFVKLYSQNDSLIHMEKRALVLKLNTENKFEEAFIIFNKLFKEKRSEFQKNDYLILTKLSIKSKLGDPYKYLKQILKKYNFFDEKQFLTNPKYQEITNTNQWNKITSKNKKNIINAKKKVPDWVDKTLVSIATEDRNIRDSLKVIRDKFSLDSDEYKIILSRMVTIDSLHAQIFYEIVLKYGFLQEPIISENASGAYWLVLQHSPLFYQLKYLPIAKEAIKYAGYDLMSYSYLIDRVNMNTGKKQIFGTQWIQSNENDKYIMYETEDIENLNHKRKLVGLNSIEEYEKLINKK